MSSSGLEHLSEKELNERRRQILYEFSLSLISKEDAEEQLTTLQKLKCNRKKRFRKNN